MRRDSRPVTLAGKVSGFAGLALACAAFGLLATADGATAQTPVLRSDVGTTPAAPAAAAKTAAKPPALAGNWSGQAQQLGKSGSFPVKVVITASGAATEYPDQDCSGKLTRIAASGDYTLYAEKIGVGAFDEAKGTGCLNGIVALRKVDGKLLFGWVGSVEDQMITVSGTLSQSAAAATSKPANPARPSRP